MPGTLLEPIDVGRAIESLPRRERLVFVLHEVLGFTLFDVAAVLEVSRSRAWQLRQAARQRLRRWLEDGSHHRRRRAAA